MHRSYKQACSNDGLKFAFQYVYMYLNVSLGLLTIMAAFALGVCSSKVLSGRHCRPNSGVLISFGRQTFPGPAWAVRDAVSTTLTVVYCHCLALAWGDNVCSWAVYIV